MHETSVGPFFPPYNTTWEGYMCNLKKSFIHMVSNNEIFPMCLDLHGINLPMCMQSIWLQFCFLFFDNNDLVCIDRGQVLQ
jgi:hypothetical protein